jgi:hypothetical protein
MSKTVFTKLIMMAGAFGVSTLLSIPAVASVNSESATNRSNTDNTIAQGMGGSGNGSGGGGDSTSPGSEGDASEPGSRPGLPSGNQDDNYNQDGTTTEDGIGGGQGGVEDNNPINPANPDAENGDAFEREPSNLPIPDDSQGGTYNQDGTTTNDGVGGGQGGVNDGTINPANPDAEGGDAFEREPSNRPLPDDNQGGTYNQDGTNQGGTTTDDGVGGGQGGVNDGTINPANPDAEGGDAFEREPSNRPLPDGNQGGTYNQDGTYNQGGTTTDDGVGGGQGGESTGVRALW